MLEAKVFAAFWRVLLPFQPDRNLPGLEPHWRGLGGINRAADATEEIGADEVAVCH